APNSSAWVSSAYVTIGRVRRFGRFLERQDTRLVGRTGKRHLNTFLFFEVGSDAPDRVAHESQPAGDGRRPAEAPLPQIRIRRVSGGCIFPHENGAGQQRLAPGAAFLRDGGRRLFLERPLRYWPGRRWQPSLATATDGQGDPQ